MGKGGSVEANHQSFFLFLVNGNGLAKSNKCQTRSFRTGNEALNLRGSSRQSPSPFVLCMQSAIYTWWSDLLPFRTERLRISAFSSRPVPDGTDCEKGIRGKIPFQTTSGRYLPLILAGPGTSYLNWWCGGGQTFFKLSSGSNIYVPLDRIFWVGRGPLLGVGPPG